MQILIQNQLKEAMRAKDSVKLETLRYVLSELKYAQIAKQGELSDEEAVNVVLREVKKRKDAIELFKNSGREGLVSDEQKKLAIIMQFLPAQLSTDDIEKIIDETITAVGKENRGLLMKEIMNKLKGRADGRVVSDIVSQKMK